jgi:ligand-binding sensor domain-containing protein/signal transduction histidine kinase
MIFDGRSLFIVLLALLPALGFGSSPQFLPQDLEMRVWTKQQGLPDDSVTAVLQTRDGYLWVGTSGGLARFDGMRFVSIAPRSIQGTINVTALCEDSAGRLWIGTQGDGLLYYADGMANRFLRGNNLIGATINSIAEDANGALWLGTPSGLCRQEGSRLTRFTAKDGLSNDFVSSVHVARSGTVWITTHGGMFQFRNGQIFPFPFQTDSPGRNPESLGVYEDRRGNLWAFGDTYLVNITAGKHLNHFDSGDATSSMRIWSLCEGQQGELWIGTSGKGLYCFADGKFLPVTLRNGGLTSDVRALCEDREGNLWLGTSDAGLVRLQPRNVRVLDASSGLANRPVTGLAFNADGRCWIGFERGGVYTGNGQNFERISGESGPELQDLVSSLCIAPNSNLWVGTPGEGLYCVTRQGTVHYTTANGLSDNFVTSVAVDSSGAAWAGTSTGSVHQFKGSQLLSYGISSGFPAEPVTALLAAPRGGLWIGFDNGAVFLEDKGAFHSAIEASALGYKSIRALHEDATGRLWLGTSAGRLGCLTGNRFSSWDLNSTSLDGSAILGILSSDDGDLWLGTRMGIYRMARKEIAALLSGESSFRPQLIFRTGSLSSVDPSYGWPLAAKAADGKLWFGIAGEVVTLDLHEPLSGVVAPPILIEDITVNDQPFPYLPPKSSGATAPVRLPPALRSLEIEFTALNLSNPEKIRFRHRLEGFDPDWVVDEGSSRKVHYGSLPSGIYTFRVQGGTMDESWFENEASFQFLVPTPLWRTGWALAIYIAAALFLVAGMARVVSHRRLRARLAVLASQQAMERERMRIAKDMHDEIGSKLTKISFMSERAKGELQGQAPVAQKLASIAHTSRDLLQTLDEIVWAVNPHNDTLENLANYLGQYATEYLQNTSVECELHIPSGLPHHPFSAETRHNVFLAFEESLNNALKHGVASRIRVDMSAKASSFQIKIVDNGRGFDSTTTISALETNGKTPGHRDGNGLRNMRERLARAGGQCTISSEPGKGATICFNVPLA